MEEEDETTLPHHEHDDQERASEQITLAAVWKGQTLGIAWMEATALRFCQVADADPDFRMLQMIKYQLNPATIVVPSSSDPAWVEMLPKPALLMSSHHGADEAAAAPHAAIAAGDHSDPRAAADREDDADDFGDQAGGRTDEDSSAPAIVFLKNRDFNAENAARRLSLLRTLEDLPPYELTERDVLLYLEHVVPREQEMARRAVSGLLAYQQHHLADQLGAPPPVSVLRRFALAEQVYMAPETFLSLGIFSDERHPSAHVGGRAKEGFSLFALFNKTRSKPGERVLRRWFSRPTQDLATLRERHSFIRHLTQHQNVALLPTLHQAVGRVKEMTKLEASLARGGLLLTDYNNVLLTSAGAVKVKELLLAAEVPTELPAVDRALRSFDDELYTVANTVHGVVDFEASASGAKLAPGAEKHISIRHGAHPTLDEMRSQFDEVEPHLNELAHAEQAQLRRLGMLPPGPGGSVCCVYVAQFGFLLQLHLEGVPSDEQRVHIARTYEGAGLAYQFDTEGEWYFKSEGCAALDEQYGDISSALKDLEATLVRHLEEKVMGWAPLLRGAQRALAELDALLSLATIARDLQLSPPTIAEDDGGQIAIQGGWHPLLHVASGAHAPVPNDCELGSESERLMLLTGPNGSGKTVYLRTVALIVYLAHVGSYVPAESARVALTDAIHTRMHSKESAAINQSAFMLDLSQMANLLKHSSKRSLCLIDEFGKGTNVQDGISLLYACLAELLRRGSACPRVLACTHFTELLEVPRFKEMRGLVLWTMSVLINDRRPGGDRGGGGGGGGGGDRDGGHRGGSGGGGAWDDGEEDELPLQYPRSEDDIVPLSAALDDEIVFLFKATRGACTDSFGSHCAAAANVPASIIKRARHISRCRAEGRPVEAIDVDNAAATNKEAALVELVDRFLAYDFACNSTAEFYRQAAHDGLLIACEAA